MNIRDSFTVQAPLGTVWDFLFDIERMGQCVPGVDSIESLGEGSYRGVLKIKIGPISANFNGLVKLDEMEPPRRIVALLEGDDKSNASRVKATFITTLSAAEDGTEIAYEMDLNLRGRLAQFGAAVMGGTAKKLTAEFANNVRATLES